MGKTQTPPEGDAPETKGEQTPDPNNGKAPESNGEETPGLNLGNAPQTHFGKAPASTVQQAPTYATPYNELSLDEDIVVEVGPRETYRNRKLEEIEPKRNVVMTKAGFENLARNEDGSAKHIPAKAIGTPVYVKVRDNSAVGGYRDDIEVTPFETPPTDDDFIPADQA